MRRAALLLLPLLFLVSSLRADTVTTRDGRSHPVFSETQSYKAVGPGETPGPILLRGWSRDDRWIFFFVVPGASGSIAADGLTLRVVPVNGGHAFQAPVFGLVADGGVERGDFPDRPFKKPPRKFPDRGLEVFFLQERRENVLGRMFPHFPLEEHLKR